MKIWKKKHIHTHIQKAFPAVSIGQFSSTGSLSHQCHRPLRTTKIKAGVQAWLMFLCESLKTAWETVSLTPVGPRGNSQCTCCTSSTNVHACRYTQPFIVLYRAVSIFLMCTVTNNTSITEEVISFSLVNHCAQNVDFGDGMQVVEVNTWEMNTEEWLRWYPVFLNGVSVYHSCW